jgi:hypothetical protein
MRNGFERDVRNAAFTAFDLADGSECDACRIGELSLRHLRTDDTAVVGDPSAYSVARKHGHAGSS